MSRDVKFGVVKFFRYDHDERYGFIIPDKGGKDVYFHLDHGAEYNGDSFVQCDQSKLKIPYRGDRVAYVLRRGAGKPRADIWAYAVSAETS